MSERIGYVCDVSIDFLEEENCWMRSGEFGIGMVTREIILNYFRALSFEEVSAKIISHSLDLFFPDVIHHTYSIEELASDKI